MPKNPEIRVVVDTRFVLELNEQEIGALDAIFGYSADVFLKAFKREMGAAYVEPYEDGVRSLHHRLRSVTSPALAEIKAVRERLRQALAPAN